MKKLKFKVGADPEFSIILQNKLVPASNLIQSLYHDRAAGTMGYNIDSHGNIGWDGASSTGEIRPSPNNDISKVVENIGKLFESFADKTRLFKLSTLSEKAPIGGHIHFELPEDKCGSVTVSNIHKKMMSFYIPVMLGENNLNLRMRTKQNYGKITDYRYEQHGNAYTYEFRVPSAEWITCPKVAEATLCYLACVYNEIINNPKNFATAKNLVSKNDAQARALQELTLSNFEALTSMICNKIKKTLKTFELYEDFKQQIDFILSPEKVIKEKERHDYDIMAGWGFTKEMPTKRQLLSERQLKERAATVDLDRLANLVNIQYNPDENVDFFIRAIKHRVIAMNWRLRNNYFLFGLKRGIAKPIAADRNMCFLYGQEQIKTIGDLQSVEGTISRMAGRFSAPRSVLLSGNSKEAVEARSREIMVGIPYDMRIGNKTKEIISLIHDIEKWVHKAKKLTASDVSQEAGGEIMKTYNANEDAAASIETVDTSNSETLARSVMAEIEQEEVPFKGSFLPAPKDTIINKINNIRLCAEL